MKIFLILFFVLFFINSVSALTNITNDNTTDTLSYDTTTIDNLYQFDTTDNIIQFSTTYNINTYPSTKSYILYDNSGNKLEVITVYSKVDGFLYDDITLKSSVKYNNAYKLFDDGNQYVYTNTTSLSILTHSLFDKVTMDGTKINLYSYIYYNPSTVTLSSTKYFNNFSINNVSTQYTYTSLNFQYRDNGISFIQSSIDEGYAALSFPFKFVFIIFKAIIKIVQIITLGYIINDLDVLTFQQFFITPLSFLDYVLQSILNILHFIFVMGTLWFITIMSLLIFIYAYLNTPHGDILKTFELFVKYETDFFTVIVKSLIWIYENVLLGILRLIRG